MSQSSKFVLNLFKKKWGSIFLVVITALASPLFFTFKVTKVITDFKIIRDSTNTGYIFAVKCLLILVVVFLVMQLSHYVKGLILSRFLPYIKKK